jgi:hypothetical protein
VSDLGRSPASYRSLVAHWRQHATSTPNRDLQSPPSQTGTTPTRLAEPPRQQSHIVTDHRIRARTHHAGKRHGASGCGRPPAAQPAKSPPTATWRSSLWPPTRPHPAGQRSARMAAASRQPTAGHCHDPRRSARRTGHRWGPSGRAAGRPHPCGALGTNGLRSSHPRTRPVRRAQ